MTRQLDHQNSSPRKYVAIVTGATGSLGRAIVEQFAKSGHYSAIHACYKSNTDVAKYLSTLPDVVPSQCDLLSETFNNLPDHVDVLVNNAGLPASKSTASEASQEEYNTLMTVNAYSPLALAQRYLSGMISLKWGRIVNVGSIWSIRGSERNLAYTMSKHALSGLTKTIAVEYGPFGITCNEVCPGPIDSEMIDRIFESRAAEAGRPADELKAEFIRSLRTQRMVLPTEVASVVSFLVSNEASGVNGVSIPVDLGLIV